MKDRKVVTKAPKGATRDGAIARMMPQAAIGATKAAIAIAEAMTRRAAASGAILPSPRKSTANDRNSAKVSLVAPVMVGLAILAPAMVGPVILVPGTSVVSP